MTAAPDNRTQDPMLLALARLSVLQRESVDRLALHDAVIATPSDADPRQRIHAVTQILQLPAARWRNNPDQANLPAMVVCADGKYGILRARNADDEWISEWHDPQSGQWQERRTMAFAEADRIVMLRLAKPYKAGKSQVLNLVIDELKSHKGKIIEGSVGGALVAFLGILMSFYSMQVYDRVIPSGAMQTLLVLTLGILLSIMLEYAAKRLRARVYEDLVDKVDQRLARIVYQRFLAIRLDQLPASVGSLASQLRGYETVRGFLIGLSSQLAVDIPFALVFIWVITAIAGPLALIPLVFFVVAAATGFWHAARIRLLAQRGQQATNRKVGLLVESVQGAEIIKSGQGGWRMLGRWLSTTDEARSIDLETRNLSEAGQYRAASLQQVSYVLMIAIGAWMASQGQITMGALLACSILSGRVFGPATQLSNQLTHWASVKAALQGLDAIWQLEDDHHGQLQPVHIEQLRGAYRFENVVMSLRGRPALGVPQLKIQPGEKIAVVGPIGSGKTTLLRLLSGMYKPGEGRIWLDDIDLAQISKSKLAEHIGYLPQEGRLLSGTLRENLTLGMLDRGDNAILAASRLTGLYDAVIASQPQGLELDINECGGGLSGGQQQLVNLTRVFLRHPDIWLLDEPTASLDRTVEQQIVRLLKHSVQQQHTLVLVTHKPELLHLVDRVIVVARHQIVLDGPRDEILIRLSQGVTASTAKTASTVASETAPMKVAG